MPPEKWQEEAAAVIRTHRLPLFLSIRVDADWKKGSHMPTMDDVYLELKKIPWFGELDDDDIRKIAGISHIREAKKGDVFFHEGDQQDYIYVVTEGRVALEIHVPPHGRIRFYTAEVWDMFGWSSVTPVVRQRTAGARAAVDCRVIATDAEKLHQLCEEDHDLGYAVMRRMANVVASRLMVTRLQLIDMFAQPPEKVDE
jgi:CRP/FNR family transcriptional regulator, cyclic AMP receptor protein